MKYYLIDGDNVIYAGSISKDKVSGHVTANITSYFKNNGFHVWVEKPLANDLHVNGRLATKFYNGQVTEYTSLDIVKNLIDTKR